MIPGRELDCGHLPFGLELNIVKTANWHLKRDFHFRLPSTVSVYHPFPPSSPPFIRCAARRYDKFRIADHSSTPNGLQAVLVFADCLLPCDKPGAASADSAVVAVVQSSRSRYPLVNGEQQHNPSTEK